MESKELIECPRSPTCKGCPNCTDKIVPVIEKKIKKPIPFAREFRSSRSKIRNQEGRREDYQFYKDNFNR